MTCAGVKCLNDGALLLCELEVALEINVKFDDGFFGVTMEV